jgi:hypothetical protein
VRIVPVPYDHPDAVKLMAAVQQVYIERYGGEDATPMSPADFDPPQGLFLVGYQGEEAVACGAWRAHDGPEPAFRPGDAEFKRMYVADSAALCGRKRAVLETGTKQPEAIALYTSSGYTEIPKFGVYRNEPESRCFGKDLTEG